jgi:hypothetical protein
MTKSRSYPWIGLAGSQACRTSPATDPSLRAEGLIALNILDALAELPLLPGVPYVADAIIAGLQNMLASHTWNPADPQWKCYCQLTRAASAEWATFKQNAEAYFGELLRRIEEMARGR